jgi:hypothetical protein
LTLVLEHQANYSTRWWYSESRIGPSPRLIVLIPLCILVTVENKLSSISLVKNVRKISSSSRKEEGVVAADRSRFGCQCAHGFTKPACRAQLPAILVKRERLGEQKAQSHHCFVSSTSFLLQIHLSACAVDQIRRA